MLNEVLGWFVCLGFENAAYLCLIELHMFLSAGPVKEKDS